MQVWKLRNVDHWLSINKITKKIEVIFFGNKDKEFYLLYTDTYTKLLAPIGQVKKKLLLINILYSKQIKICLKRIFLAIPLLR